MAKAVKTAIKKKVTYDAKDIVWIDDPMEQVRTHPTMYVGGVDQTAVRHLAIEIIANSNDEATAGFGDVIKFTVTKAGQIIVEDNGRGVPVDPHPKNPKLSAAEVAFTQLHAGAKSAKGSSYDASLGVHGIGSAAVNALSSALELEIKRDGKVHRAEFKCGKITKRLKVVGKCPKSETGTKVTFTPDASILKTTNVNWQPIVDWLDMLAYLNSRLTYIVDIQPTKIKQTIRHKNGLADWLALNTKEKNVMGKAFVINTPSADIALQWTDASEEHSLSYVSGGRTVDGGTHAKAVEKAISAVLDKFTTTKGALKKGYKPEDLRVGLVSLVNVRVKSPRFSSQTKEKLVSPEGEEAVYKVLVAELKAFFDKNKTLARTIIERANNLRSAFDEYKMNAKAAAKLKTKRGTHGLPSKLHNCKSNKAEECELYLVEGDGAGGTAKNARDVTFQAVLPLKGKPPNVVSGNLEKILATNEEVLNILRSIGYDPSNKKGPLEKLRFGKIIILADADVDGKHITNLVLATLWKLTPSLIRDGRVFIVSDALFMAKTATKTVFGRTRKEAIEKSGAKNPVITRIKGWGELNATDMTPIAFDRKERQLIRVTPEQPEKLLKVMSEDAKFKRELLGV